MSLSMLLVLPYLAIADTTSLTAMQQLLPPAVGQWTLSGSSRSYPGDDIFEYMNGAAEIYRAYRFSGLIVARYVSSDSAEILVELFDMASPRNAFGVFSHVRGAGPPVEAGQGGDYEGGLLCFWKGRYFTCVKAEEETPRMQAGVLAIGRAISGNISETGEEPPILRFLPEGEFHPETLRYFFRNEILEMHYYVADANLLHLEGEAEAVLVRMKADGSHLLLVGYAGTADADSAYDDFRSHYMPDAGEASILRTENGRWTACMKQGVFVAVVFDASAPERARGVIQELRRRLP